LEDIAFQLVAHCIVPVERSLVTTVVYQLKGKPRPQPVKEMATVTSNPHETVRHLIGYLYNNELDKPYNLIRDNCQTFAKRIMKGTITDIHKFGFKDTESFKVAKGNHV
jgi:hypothetical protein